jgi:integrase
MAEALWDVPLSELTHRHFSQLWSAWARGEYATPSGKRRPNPPKASTIRTLRRVLSVALNEAIPDLIQHNPTVRAKPPKQPPASNVEHWDRDDVRRFLHVSDRTPLAAYWRLAATVGPRPGELRALRWADVNLDNGTVRFRGSLEDNRGALNETKTMHHREVRIAGPTLAALCRHRAQQQTVSTWVFCHGAGERIGRSYSGTFFREEFERLRVEAGCPPMRMYSLRHTAAGLMLRRGLAIAEVAAVLGHASPTTTLKYYSLYLPSRAKEAADIMADELPDSGVFGAVSEIGYSNGLGQAEGS